MEKAIKFGKTIRNNWKKSVFGVIASNYVVSKAKEKYDINILMQAACKEAAVYGDSLIPMDRNPTLVTVILNPVANKRKAKQDFEKYCEPLLLLAGLQIDVKHTTSEGHAKELVETLRGTEAIIVAGGDGTLSETVTGLLRRKDDANQFPLGILPLGKTNTIANTMFPGGDGAEKVKQLIEASMAIIKGSTQWKDAMKIEPIANEDEVPNRPIYALSAIEWGAFRDTEAKKDKYWLWGPLRDYASYVFNGYKESLTWNCSGTLKYSPPCPGCNNCLTTRPQVKTKWSFFMPSMQAATLQESAKQINPECSVSQEICFKTCDFKIVTPNIHRKGNIPSLNIILGRNSYSYSEFVSEGWNRIKSNNDNKANKVVEARSVEILPNQPGDGVVFGIDKEDFDVKPVKITLLPKIVKLFCKPELLNHG